jgi:hypothetical protein
MGQQVSPAFNNTNHLLLEGNNGWVSLLPSCLHHPLRAIREDLAAKDKMAAEYPGVSGLGFVIREDTRATVTAWIQADACRHCLQGKAAELGTFYENMTALAATEKRLCIFTLLSILSVAEETRPRRVRSTGERSVFRYYVPFVGRVCKGAFLTLFAISSSTLARYKLKVRRGWLVDKQRIINGRPQSFYMTF